MSASCARSMPKGSYAKLKAVPTTSFSINVKLLNGSSTKINVRAENTVEDVKVALQSLCGLPPMLQQLMLQRLSFDDQLLEDSAVLGECKIEAGSQLYLLAPPSADVGEYMRTFLERRKGRKRVPTEDYDVLKTLLTFVHTEMAKDEIKGNAERERQDAVAKDHTRKLTAFLKKKQSYESSREVHERNYCLAKTLATCYHDVAAFFEAHQTSYRFVGRSKDKGLWNTLIDKCYKTLGKCKEGDDVALKEQVELFFNHFHTFDRQGEQIVHNFEFLLN